MSDEKKWCVEVWNSDNSFGFFSTELFYTKRDAEDYFKKIRKSVDSSKFIIQKDSIVSMENPNDSVYSFWFINQIVFVKKVTLFESLFIIFLYIKLKSC